MNDMEDLAKQILRMTLESWRAVAACKNIPIDALARPTWPTPAPQTRKLGPGRRETLRQLGKRAD